MVALARGVAPVDEWSWPAQAGSAFGAVVLAGAALAKGFAWLLNWHGERTDGKAARLQAWENKLVEREIQYRAGIEGRLAAAERQVIGLHEKMGALGSSLFEVTTELRVHNPASPALKRAEAALQLVAPPNFPIPEDIRQMAARLDSKDAADD